ncbi:DUF3037 domain-containing protein [Leptolyngbya sp. FACHB-36]|uniref:DUF3037 domain-containing protein n=1 Tax=Leptolyngbya sp. FACHB-36 TaxID=2692808 RepID=UPI0016811D63|nr:DUF3037 domain-containing protein [Leptolyngbya sp. FACHB-36]
MHDHVAYDYAIIRVVPKVEREEFINVGAIVSCATRRFLDARIELDEQRLLALDATLDMDLIRDHLAVIPMICAGGKEAGAIGQLPQRERFHWVVAPRSTIIQTSRVHTGLCKNPSAALEHLINRMVRPVWTESCVVEAELVEAAERIDPL